TLSIAAEVGAGRLDRLRMGRLGEQPQGEVLQAHSLGPETTRKRSKRVEPDHRNRRTVLRHPGGTVMRKLRAWLLRFKGLFLTHARERDFADELDSHLPMHIDDNIRTGMSPQEARRVAIMKLGGVDQAKEA